MRRRREANLGSGQAVREIEGFGEEIAGGVKRRSPFCFIGRESLKGFSNFREEDLEESGHLLTLDPGGFTEKSDEIPSENPGAILLQVAIRLRIKKEEQKI